MTEDYHGMPSAPLLEVAGTFDPFVGVIRLPAPLEQYEAGNLANADALQLRRLLTGFHEFVHHLQSVGTSFGSMLYSAAQAKQQFSFAYLTLHQALAEQGERTPFPIEPLLRRVPPQLREMLGEMTRAITIPHARIDAADSAQVPWLGFAPAPIVTVGQKSYAMTGRVIIEGHARFVQAFEPMRFRRAGATERAMSEAAATLPDGLTYLGAHMHYLASNVPKEYHPLHFAVLLDFALGGPVLSLPDAENEWIASHPGYRFVRALQRLHTVRPIRFDADDLGSSAGSDCVRFYEEISYACGFGSFFGPYDLDYDDLVERIAAHREDAGRSGPLPSEHDYQRLIAIALRREYPLAFALPNFVPQWLDAIFERLRPYWSIEERLFGIREDTPYAPQYLDSFPALGLAYHTFAEQLFRRAPLTRRQLECHIRRFDVTNVCPHYEVRCKGLIDPQAGWPTVTDPPCIFGQALAWKGLVLHMLDMESNE